METIRDSAISRAEDYFGRKIQYGSMGPSIFGTLDIRDIRILREDGSVLLNVSRLRVSYSLGELIRRGAGWLFSRARREESSAGSNGSGPENLLDAFHSVRIDRPVLSLDFEKDRDLAERFASDGKSAPGEAAGPQNSAPAPEETGETPAPEETLNFRALFPENFSLRVWNGEWDISGSAGSFNLREFRLDASIRQDRIGFQGRWNAEASLKNGARALFAAEDDASAFFEAVMTGRINGEYSADSREGSAAVTIPSLYGDNFRLKPLTVSFFLSGSRLEARKTHDRSPSALSFVYDLESRNYRAGFEGENFFPGDLLIFTNSWKSYEPLLAFRISGRANIEKEASGGLLYNLDFSGGMPGNSVSGPGSLAVKASGNEKRVIFETLSVLSSYGDLNFNGELGFSPFAPQGFLSVSELNLQNADGNSGSKAREGISGDFSVSTNGPEINIFGENVSSGGVNLSALDGRVYREEEGLAFALSVLRFRNIESYDDVRTSTISLEGSVDYERPEETSEASPGGGGEGRHIQASLSLDSFSVGDILGFIEPLAALPAMSPLLRSAAENLSVTTEVFFTTDYEHILYNAPRVVAAYEGFGNVLASASLSGTSEHFELNEGRVSWQNGNATLSGSVDFSDLADISFSLGTTYKNLTYYLEGMVLDRKNISVRGSYGFQAYLSASETGEYSGYIEGDNIPLPSGDSQASLGFMFSLFYDTPALWRADIERFELTGLTTPSSAFTTLRFSGAASENGLNIPNLFFDDGNGALGGDISLDWDSSYSFCRFRADLANNSRAETYSLNGNYREEGLELFLAGRGMRFSRVSALNAVADGNVRLIWESPESFEAETELNSLVLRSGGSEITASAKAGVNADSFSLSQLEINYSGLGISVPRLFVDRAAARAEAQVSVRGNLSGREVNVSSRANAVFNTSQSWLDIIGGISSASGTLIVDTARFDTIAAAETFDFTFSCLREENGLALNLSGGPRNMLRLRYSPEETGGNFYAAFSAPSPVRGSVAGFISGESIDARGTDLYVDMGSLWRFMPTDTPVAFPGGIVTASIRVSGDLEDPEFSGSARGTGVQILVPDYLPEPIRPVPVTFSLTGSEITFGPVDALVGGGAGTASAWFRFDRWIPNTFNIDIQVPQNTPIPYDFNISGVMAHGLVSGKLGVGMEDSILSLTGDLSASNTEISVDSGQMTAPETEGPPPDGDKHVFTTADIRINTGRRVEFFWPSVDFPVLQAYPDMGTGIRVTFDEMARRFTITGDVRLRGGELFYLTRNFYVREGNLLFNEDEVEFDPLISARAEIRDQAEDGPVTISLIIDNAPLRSFTPRFESNPPLSQLEIYSILGQNPQGGEAGESSQNIAASAVADLFTQFAVLRRFQRQARDFLGLDMFSVRTRLLQNLVLEAAGARSVNDAAVPTDGNIDRPYRVGNYFDNTTVYIGKYFGADLFGQAMLSFKYDENKSTFGGLVFEPEIGLEMRNPLFDIRFNMVPLHPENYFINDVSFSLLWRRSF